MATLGKMYPARGGSLGSDEGVLSKVRGSTPPREVCITYWLFVNSPRNHIVYTA